MTFHTAIITMLAFFLASANAQHAPDKVHVAAKLSSDHKDPKKSPKEIVEETMQLTLINHTSDELNNATLKVIYYARDLEKDITVVQKSLEKHVSFKAREELQLSMPAVMFEFTPTHGVLVKGRRGRISSKRVPASGQRYSGYAVQILQDGKVIGETFSAPQFNPAINGKK